MVTAWFVLVAAMLAVYVVLDGFDLGSGIAHLFVARGEEERESVLAAIGPFWDGNEVWLIAAGGTLVFAFPALYAASFSGFFLPLMLVLWLLMGRGIAIEFRHHVRGPVWRPFWDVVFSASSGLLALFYGTALGAVVRGVPLDGAGNFFQPFFTDFRPVGRTGIIDWFTLLVGLLAFAALAMHGGLWLSLKTDGALGERARLFALRAWGATAFLAAAVSVAVFRVQPHVARQMEAHPWGGVLPAAAFAGLAAARAFAGTRAFLGSCLFLVGLLSATAFGLYPDVLPCNTDPALSLTARGAAASAEGLRAGLLWWIPGMLLVVAYSTFIYRRFAGKVAA